MFASLFLLPSSVTSPDDRQAATRRLAEFAREFSPRITSEGSGLVTLDAHGLGRLLGDARAIGEQLRRGAADRSLPVHVAVAATRTAAALLASERAGLTVVPPGEEASALVPLPIEALRKLSGPEVAGGMPQAVLDTLKRWGLRTLGEFAALPPVPLFERIGQEGPRWQRLARGEDLAPLVPDQEEEPFEASLDLEWPIEGLEPLSFVFGRLFDELCARLEREDRAAAVLHVALRLVTREVETRSLQLPAPMRDARTLRTLVLLDLEARPVQAGIDRVMVAADPAPGRITQFSLLARALPEPESLSTLVARLAALMGEGRVGAVRLPDSHRPGAFEMVSGSEWVGGVPPAGAAHMVAERPPEDGWGRPAPRLALRRFRLPVPAHVLVEHGQPVRVTTDRHALAGGRVEACAGPWRSSGEWWRLADARLQLRLDGRPGQVGWDRDEWDVALGDGGVYRVYRDRERNRWFVDGIVD